MELSLQRTAQRRIEEHACQSNDNGREDGSGGGPEQRHEADDQRASRGANGPENGDATIRAARHNAAGEHMTRGLTAPAADGRGPGVGGGNSNTTEQHHPGEIVRTQPRAHRRAQRGSEPIGKHLQRVTLFPLGVEAAFRRTGGTGDETGGKEEGDYG